MYITNKVSTYIYNDDDNERCRLPACMRHHHHIKNPAISSTNSSTGQRKTKKTEKFHVMMQRSIRQVLNRTVRNRRMMTSWVEDMNKGLTEVDPEICDIIEKEKHRQRSSLCLIGKLRVDRLKTHSNT